MSEPDDRDCYEAWAHHALSDAARVAVDWGLSEVVREIECRYNALLAADGKPVPKRQLGDDVWPSLL